VCCHIRVWHHLLRNLPEVRIYLHKICRVGFRV
jgi:hypothetical protein